MCIFSKSVTLAIAGLGFAVLLAATAANAENGRLPAKIVMGQKEVSRDSFIYRFAEAAFSKSYQQQGGWLDTQAAGSIVNKDNVREFAENYPWIAPYMVGTTPLPRPFSINKWHRQVNVAFGYPDDLRPKNGKSELIIADSYASARYPDVEARAEKTVAAAIPQLQAATGLDIGLGKNTAAGGLHIIFTDNVYYRTSPFKVEADKPAYTSTGTHNTLEFRSFIERQALPMATHFTPGNMRQVDGFFLPDSDNGITAAFCFIYKDLPPALQDNLVRECLVRSLGLPGLQTTFKDALTSAWNAEGKAESPIEISDFDILALKTLYSGVIKPGMSPGMAFAALH